MIRPASLRWPDWIERCRTQGTGAIATLAAEPWPDDAPLDQPQITTACMLRYVRMADPDLLPPGRCPSLDALSARCEASPPSRPPGPRSTCSRRRREGRLRAATTYNLSTKSRKAASNSARTFLAVA